MKWWQCAALAAAVLIGGGTARADNLILPSGEVLPLGQAAVWQGSRSYFADRVGAVLADPTLPEAMAADLLQYGIYGPGEKDEAARTSATILSLLQACRAYQIRSVTSDTMHAAYVLSFPTEGIALPGGMTQGAAHREANAPAGAAVPGQGTASGRSKRGISYSMAWMRIAPEINGYVVPLWVCTLETAREGQAPTVTLIVTNQASGAHFQPLLVKAAEEAQ